jgi:ATP-dependent protease ClpP protease subunit
VNKRRREFLNALTPAVDFAMRACGEYRDRDFRDVTGLALHAATAETPAELLIYGQIGGGFWSDGVTASDVAAALQAAGPGPLHVRINSGGGDVFQGTAIYSLLAMHRGLITTTVDGLAASAASIIMLAGDLIEAPKHAFIMIHDAMTYTYGNPETHHQAGDLLDKVSGTLAEMYADRAGEDAAHWRAKMTENAEDGTWYTGTEAMEAGLVDQIVTITTGEDEQTEDELVAARLDGWSGMLAPQARAFLAEHRKPEPETPAPPVWDNKAFAEMMRGAFA